MTTTTTTTRRREDAILSAARELAGSRAKTVTGAARAILAWVGRAGPGERRRMVALALAPPAQAAREPVTPREAARRRAAADVRFRRAWQARFRRAARRMSLAEYAGDREELTRDAAALGSSALVLLEERYQDLLEYARRSARVGGVYSGDTTASGGVGRAAAYTHISTGDRYSSRCQYSRRDAEHRVTVCPSVDILPPAVRERSLDDGLPVIKVGSPEVDGDTHVARATWVRKVGKQIGTAIGWVAWTDTTLTHGWTTSAALDALRKQTKKMKRLSEEIVVSRTPLARRWVTRDSIRAAGACAPGIEEAIQPISRLLGIPSSQMGRVGAVRADLVAAVRPRWAGRGLVAQ